MPAGANTATLEKDKQGYFITNGTDTLEIHEAKDGTIIMKRRSAKHDKKKR